MSGRIHYYAVNIVLNVFHIQIKFKNNFMKCIYIYPKKVFMVIKQYNDGNRFELKRF